MSSSSPVLDTGQRTHLRRPQHGVAGGGVVVGGVGAGGDHTGGVEGTPAKPGELRLSPSQL